MSNDVRANRAEINRLTKAIAAEEQNINLAFQRIGQTYFAAHRNDPEEAQKAGIQAVLDAMHRANAYKDQINVLRGIAICPNCKSEVDISAAFCSRCGTRMSVQTPPMTPDAPICPNCGNAYAPGTRFCNQCGTRLPESAPAAPAAPYAAPARQNYAPMQSPIPAPSYAPAKVTAPVTSFTPSADEQPPEQVCSSIPEPVFQAPQNPNTVLVFNSVTESAPAAPVPEEDSMQETAPSFDSTPEQTPVAEPTPEQPATPVQRFCANCGTPLDPDYRFCLECGTPVL